jgi:hemolysin III
MPTKPRVPDHRGDPRPLLRGWLHAGGLVLLVPMSIWLVQASSPWVRPAVVIYVLSLLLTVAVSSAYHIAARSQQAQQVMRRVDHSMIFVLIAGTYTPVVVVVLQPPMRWWMLALVWVGAAVGVVLTSLHRLPRVSLGMYIALGWVAVICAPALVRYSMTAAVLLLLGGVAYTAGAVMYAMRRPRLSPAVFGSHEVFHACTLAGFGLHFAAIALLVTPTT